MRDRERDWMDGLREEERERKRGAVGGEKGRQTCPFPADPWGFQGQTMLMRRNNDQNMGTPSP